jgi:hypothetical protein
MAPTYLGTCTSFLWPLLSYQFFKSVCFFTSSDGSKKKDFCIMGSEILMGLVAKFKVPDRGDKVDSSK